MAKKQFKTESKKLLDMMINSIYTNKEIFLRELISNASDAIDKLYYRSLTDDSVKLKRADYKITVKTDKKTLTISDNGCGMTKDELENNLGTIAKSGSFDFKAENEKKEDVDIIGQFGVGFYSAFMVADKITVISKAYGQDTAYRWESEGADGYTIDETEKESAGTDIILTLKEDKDGETYSDYANEYTIKRLVKKYSDYIHYPIVMEVTKHELKEGSKDEYEDKIVTETLNSQKPIWKKNQKEVKKEEYDGFYRDQYYDYEEPLKVITQKSEGLVSYEALLFIPKHAPFDYYTKNYEKGLTLYSSGVMITEKCKELLPDYFGFVKGIVDTQDLSLNISRETLQQDRQLKVIAKGVEKKIKDELSKMLENEREQYEEFFKAFGMQLKYGLYQGYGANKDALQDLILFPSSNDKKLTTLNEYVGRMKEDQKSIYYACGETADKVSMLPQVCAVLKKGYEVLYCTEDVDEFALSMLQNYKEKDFKNVCTDKLDLSTEEEKEELKKENESQKDLLDCMKETLGDAVSSVQFTDTLGEYPVSLSSEGEISVEMEKVLSKMPGAEGQMLKAQTVLQINKDHKIAQKIKDLYQNDKDGLKNYTKILYAQARLINGLSLDNPSEISQLILNYLA